MALNRGKQDIQTLTVNYSKRKVYQQFQYVSPFSGGGALGTLVTTIDYVYEYHRYATRRYKYTGLSQGDALTLAQSVLNSYNRAYWISDWHSDGDAAGTFVDKEAGHKLQGSIVAQRVNGCIWEVSVNITEDDMKLDPTGTKSVETLFSKENARGYDY